MLCDQTEILVADYFDESLSAAARSGIDQHLQQCANCRQEIEAMQLVVRHALHWQEQTVPAWNRAHATIQGSAKEQAFDRPGVHSGNKNTRSENYRWPAVSAWWQWGPMAASLVMAIAVIFNLQITSSDNGFSVAFGGNDSPVSSAVIAEQLQLIEQQQRAETLAAVQGVLQQFGDSNAENLSRIVDYFERQRQLDLQQVQAGYQQLIDSDYETIRSMQQLASYVQFQDGL